MPGNSQAFLIYKVMNHITTYNLFESMEPVKNLTEVTLQKEENPQVKIFLTLDRMNRVIDVRSPGGIRHIFRRGNMLNKSQMENWMNTNGFVELNRIETKKQLKGNELVKFMMKKGYR